MIFVLMAAHDTSTITLTTMAYYMAKHPEWQAAAREQSRELPPEISYDTLDRFTVLDAIMKESLRLNAPVPGLPRRAVQDTEICGHFIPKGTYVSAIGMVSHHDPALWTDPERFDPDRFSPERAEDRVHRFAWMPFGGGVHKCIGLYFGRWRSRRSCTTCCCGTSGRCPRTTCGSSTTRRCRSPRITYPSGCDRCGDRDDDLRQPICSP